MSSPSHTPDPPQILLDTLFPSQSLPPAISLHDPHFPSRPIPTPLSTDTSKPFVTLTFAQSLDGRIAGEGGKQLFLSGKQSLLMTHWMRSMHDGILVGIGTALNDNPQLNVRHMPPLPPSAGHLRYHLPRPIILDTNLRLNPDCKLIQNYTTGQGRRPWIVGSPPLTDIDGAENGEWKSRKEALEQAGARVIEVDLDKSSGRLSIPSVLTTLRVLGIRSLMIEGGAAVIKSFITSAQSRKDNPESTEDSRPRVDAIIVTVAPTFVGKEGIGYGEDLLGRYLPKMQHVKTEVFGVDTVVALRVS